MNTLGRLWYVLWPPLLIVVVLISLWQLAVVLLDIPEFLLPAPLEICFRHAGAIVIEQ